VCQLVEPFNAAERVGHFVKYELTLNSKYLMTSRASKHTGRRAQTHRHTHVSIFVNYQNKSC
jgi:hypothetical protein